MEIVELSGTILDFVSALVYGALLILFVAQPNNSERFKFLLIAIGVFVILALSQGTFLGSAYNRWPFMFTQMVILSFLALSGIPLMIQKETVVVLLLVFVIGLNSNFALALLIGITSYIVVSFKLLSTAFKIVKGWFGG